MTELVPNRREEIHTGRGTAVGLFSVVGRRWVGKPAIANGMGIDEDRGRAEYLSKSEAGRVGNHEAEPIEEYTSRQCSRISIQVRTRTPTSSME